MATATSLEDSLKYMIEYHPYKNGENPNHTNGSDSQTLKGVDILTVLVSSNAKKKFRDALRSGLERRIINEESNKDNVVIAIAPGHSPTSKSNFLPLK